MTFVCCVSVCVCVLPLLIRCGFLQVYWKSKQKHLAKRGASSWKWGHCIVYCYSGTFKPNAAAFTENHSQLNSFRLLIILYVTNKLGIKNHFVIAKFPWNVFVTDLIGNVFNLFSSSFSFLPLCVYFSDIPMPNTITTLGLQESVSACGLSYVRRIAHIFIAGSAIVEPNHTRYIPSSAQISSKH